MSAPLSRPRLEFAAVAFLAEMRRRYTAAHPDRDNPVRPLEEYSPEQRSDLMAALQKAIVSASPDADKTYQTWLERRSTGENQGI